MGARLPSLRTLQAMGTYNAEAVLFAWERDTRAALEMSFDSFYNHRAARDRKNLKSILARIEKARGALFAEAA